ncbi:MAG: exodeoxyribonuclease VII large subunit [Bacteroidia bacterium]|nr:exodeoxyribonuclease VII large subunit [Bacteroidia bacterium]
MDAFSLHELNEFIKRILAFNLPDEIWVQCELAQVGYSRGNYYIELVEKDEAGDVIIAQSSAALWRADYSRLKKKHGDPLEDVLREGIEVMLKVKVEFHERYGLKLVIKDIDMHFIMGKVEQQRRETIEKLQKEGLLDANNQLDLPPVLQRIAILSAQSAAGYQDFIKQLGNNQFGYDYELTLFEIALQGQNTESTVINALKQVNKRSKEYDCIVIVRGGGSKLDLAAFDALELNRNLAKAKLPVLTGIGHEIDETVADMVAYSSLKTPTAMAEFLIQRSYNFEADILEKYDYLRNFALEKLKTHELLLSRMQEQILANTRQSIGQKNDQLDYQLDRMVTLAKQKLRSESKRIPILERTLDLLTIESTLSRGFTVTQFKGRALRKSDIIEEGSELITISQSLEITSTVEKVNEKK